MGASDCKSENNAALSPLRGRFFVAFSRSLFSSEQAAAMVTTVHRQNKINQAREELARQADRGFLPGIRRLTWLF